MAPYRQSLEAGHITFNELRSLARKADIPYALFFAPQTFVDKEIKRKSDLLLAGTSKIPSRSTHVARSLPATSS
jgi:hypothetical protein